MVSTLHLADKPHRMDDGNHRIHGPPRHSISYHKYNKANIERLKFSAVVLNTLLFALASIMLAVAVFALVRYKSLGYDKTFESVTIAIISLWMAVVSSALGVAMIPLCGCHGVVAQRKNLLILFFLFLLVMLVMDIVMCVWVTSTATKIQVEFEISIRNALAAYDTDPVFRATLNDIQIHIGCCGSDQGVADYGDRGPPPTCINKYLFVPCNEKMNEIYISYRFVAVGVFGALALLLMIDIVLVLSLLTAIKPSRPSRPPPQRRKPDITMVEAPKPHNDAANTHAQQPGVVNLETNVAKHNTTSV